MAINKALLKKIGIWNMAQKQLADIKKQEAELRAEVFAALFDNGEFPLKEGANKLDLPDGWSITATHKLNYNIDEAVISDTLEQMREKGFSDLGLVKYKPSLSVAEYRKIDDEMKGILSAALTIKPGSPSMKLIPPKEGK